MKTSSLFRICLIPLLIITIGLKISKGQLKLGNNPTQIEKSAILELESANQGLLLTRVSDTSDATGIDKNNPPDGMIIYYTDANNHGLFIRKDGWWHELITKDGDGIVSLNGDKAKNQTLTFSSDAGSPLGFLTPVNGAQVLNIPLASSDKTGLITNNGQIIGGTKTFLKSPTIDDMTLGSITFIGPDKLLSQDNGNLYWDDIGNKLGIDLGNGIMPGNALEINSGVTGNGGLRFTKLNAASTPISGAGAIGVNADGDVVRIQNGITSLNELSDQSQKLETGSAGNDFNISSANAVHTFNLPNASTTARGVITFGSQTIGGWKTFNESPSIAPLNTGSILFVGSAPTNKISESNNSLYWDDADKQLGVGTNVPKSKLDVNGNFKLGQSGSVLSNMYTYTILNPNISISYGLLAGLLSNGTLKPFTFEVPNVKTGDHVQINLRSALPQGLIISWVIVSSANHIEIGLTYVGSTLGSVLSGGTLNYNDPIDVLIIQ